MAEESIYEHAYGPLFQQAADELRQSNKKCQACGVYTATDLHHRDEINGDSLPCGWDNECPLQCSKPKLNVRTLLSVCRWCHDEITSVRKTATLFPLRLETFWPRLSDRKES